MPEAPLLARIQAALETVAELVAVDMVYAPVFERLEAELAAARAAAANSDPVTRARLLIDRQRHMA